MAEVYDMSALSEDVKEDLSQGVEPLDDGVYEMRWASPIAVDYVGDAIPQLSVHLTTEDNDPVWTNYLVSDNFGGDMVNQLLHLFKKWNVTLPRDVEWPDGIVEWAVDQSQRLVESGEYRDVEVEVRTWVDGWDTLADGKHVPRIGGSNNRIVVDHIMPIGTYLAEIIAIYPGFSKGGTPYTGVTLWVAEPDHIRGRLIFAKLWRTKKSHNAWAHGRLLHAVRPQEVTFPDDIKESFDVAAAEAKERRWPAITRLMQIDDVVALVEANVDALLGKKVAVPLVIEKYPEDRDDANRWVMVGGDAIGEQTTYNTPAFLVFGHISNYDPDKLPAEVVNNVTQRKFNIDDIPF